MSSRSLRLPGRHGGARLGFYILLLGLVSGFCAEEPLYLPADGIDSAAVLAPPPLPGSAEQAADMAEVINLSKAATSNETAAALSEKKFSLLTFAPALGEVFHPGQFPVTEAFFERVQGEAALATDQAKKHWKRPRPYTINPALASGKLETSFSYPSGHSTEATVLALLLAELLPAHSEQVLQIGRNIGWHRVLIARHYATDIYAGRVFALALVRKMKSNAAFQHDWEAVKLEIAGKQAPSEAAVPAGGGR